MVYFTVTPMSQCLKYSQPKKHEVSTTKTSTTLRSRCGVEQRTISHLLIPKQLSSSTIENAEAHVHIALNQLSPQSSLLLHDKGAYNFFWTLGPI